MPSHFSIQLTAMATYDLRSHELASVWPLRIIAKTNIWHIAMTVIRLDVSLSSCLELSSTLRSIQVRSRQIRTTKIIGAVTFRVPSGVKAAKVRWGLAAVSDPQSSGTCAAGLFTGLTHYGTEYVWRTRLG